MRRSSRVYKEGFAELREKVGDKVRKLLQSNGLSRRSFLECHYHELGYGSPTSAGGYLTCLVNGHPTGIGTDMHDNAIFSDKEEERLSTVFRILGLAEDDPLIAEIKKMASGFYFSQKPFNPAINRLKWQLNRMFNDHAEQIRASGERTLNEYLGSKISEYESASSPAEKQRIMGELEKTLDSMSLDERGLPLLSDS